jgi:hypothetical protein
MEFILCGFPEVWFIFYFCDIVSSPFLSTLKILSWISETADLSQLQYHMLESREDLARMSWTLPSSSRYGLVISWWESSAPPEIDLRVSKLLSCIHYRPRFAAERLKSIFSSFHTPPNLRISGWLLSKRLNFLDSEFQNQQVMSAESPQHSEQNVGNRILIFALYLKSCLRKDEA